MHEMGLAEGVLDIVRQHVPLERAAEVREVIVRIGAQAGVLPDSLEFCFSAIVAGTPYASARLAIEQAGGRELQVVAVELGPLEGVAS